LRPWNRADYFVLFQVVLQQLVRADFPAVSLLRGGFDEEDHVTFERGRLKPEDAHLLVAFALPEVVDHLARGDVENLAGFVRDVLDVEAFAVLGQRQPFRRSGFASDLTDDLFGGLVDDEDLVGAAAEVECASLQEGRGEQKWDGLHRNLYGNTRS